MVDVADPVLRGASLSPDHKAPLVVILLHIIDGQLMLCQASLIDQFFNNIPLVTVGDLEIDFRHALLSRHHRPVLHDLQVGVRIVVQHPYMPGIINTLDSLNILG